MKIIIFNAKSLEIKFKIFNFRPGTKFIFLFYIFFKFYKIIFFLGKKPNKLYIYYNYKNIFINSKYFYRQTMTMILKDFIRQRLIGEIGKSFTHEYHTYSIRKLRNKNLSKSVSQVRKNKYLPNTNKYNYLKVQNNSNLNQKNVPWKITSSIIKAQENLCTFYEWLNLSDLEQNILNSKKSYIKEFIDKNCRNLLIKPNFEDNYIIGLKDTGISLSKFDLSNLNLDLSANPDLKSEFIDCKNLNSRILENLNRKSLIYSFINKQSKRQYIGSSINPESRLHTYLFAWRKARQRFLEEVRNNGGLNSYIFNIGVKIPNYLNIFELENPNINLDVKLIFILNCFSEFHVKLVFVDHKQWFLILNLK